MYSPPSLRGIRPRRFDLASWSPHIAFGYDLVADLRPRVLVELGTRSGESYFAFCQSVEENRTGTTCYAVDAWLGGGPSGSEKEDAYADVQRHNEQFYAGFSTLVRASGDEALDRFADGSVDLIHFNGLPTYEALRHDFAAWRRKLSPRGVALFHDVAARHDDFGAWRFWEEIHTQGENFEFPHGQGLGVWKPVGGEWAESPLLRALFSAGESQAENIRHYYAMAADALRQRTLAPAAKAGANGFHDGRAVLALHGRDLATSFAVPKAEPEVQVYFPDTDGGFSEENSRYFQLTANRWDRLKVPLPETWRGGSLRIDPGHGFGLVDIAGVRIVSEVLDEVVWELLGADLLAGIKVVNDAQAVPNPRLLRLLCVEGDPQIILPEIDLTDYDEPLRLEIGIRVRTDPASFGHTLREWAQEMHGLPDLRAKHKQATDALASERTANQAATQTVAEWQWKERACARGTRRGPVGVARRQRRGGGTGPGNRAGPRPR